MFACLAAQNGRAVPRDELAELLWGEDLPATWEKALRVLMTKLRALLEECGIDGSTALTSAFGCYKLTLPAGAWIDVDAAVEALERAEAALAGADRDEARSQANVAAALARRTFLPGEDGPWVEEKRRDLRDVLVRALECMRDATFGAGEYAEAVRHAEEVTELEPFRESGYRRLMECHAAAGNTAEALRVYEGCRRFLADELGAYPSPETEAAYLEILRAERASATQDEAQVEDVPPDRRRPVAVALLGAIVVVAAAAAVVAYGRTNGPAVGSADNPITIVTAGLGTDPEQEAFEAMLRTFEQTTGFEAELQKFPVSEPSYVDWIRRRVEEGSAPTLAILGPGNLADFAREGVAKPLASLGLGEDRLRQSYGRAWLDLATVDGELYGFPNGAISKSLLWYRPDDLERLGLRVPRTWAGLVSATRKLERAGETPWALAAGDAWTLTDWFENVYLRTAGPWRYDALFAGKLPFDDPSVLAALRRMTRILRDEYVAGGISGALATSFPDALEHVFGREPRAQLYMEGGFVGPLALESIRPRPRPGRSIAAAPLPHLRSGPAPVVVAADFIVPFADDETVSALLRYLSSPGASRILVSSGAVVSPHRRVPKSAYPNALLRSQARQLVSAEVVRFDGSDLLPGKLASEFGSALQAVLERPENAAALMREFQRTAARAFNG